MQEDERTQRIRLVEDLRVGLNESDPGAVLQAPSDVAVDRDGRMYVVDQSQRALKLYDADGSYVRTLGRRGEGPGDFQRPGAVAVFGEYVAATDETLHHLNIWDQDGVLVGAPPFESALEVVHLDGTPGGFLIGAARARSEYRLYRFDRQAKVVGQFPSLRRRTAGPRIEVEEKKYVYGPLIGVGQPWFATGPAGEVYVAAGDEYQVLAFTPSGDAKWALRVSWPRPPLSQVDIDFAVGALQQRSDISATANGWERVTQSKLEAVAWPERQPALSRGNRYGGHAIKTDGRGRVYVFPYTPLPWLLDGRERPVDVYSPDGERLLAGLIESRSWVAAYGDFIYGIDGGQESREPHLIRYRLVLPGEE